MPIGVILNLAVFVLVVVLIGECFG
jgi:hypothetical protein